MAQHMQDGWDRFRSSLAPLAVDDHVFPGMRPVVLKGDAAVCTIVVDAEEDFDWLNPVYGTQHTTANMHNTRILQEIAGAYGLAPTYLLTYPILDAPEVVQALRRRVDRGECEVGVQLHPWVTPPFDHGSASATSFAGNLAPELERRKLMELTRKFQECFGTAPRMYRAGRYGLGEHSADLLAELGFTIDTSLAPRTNFAFEGGPDYSSYGYCPFWFGGRARLLEMPLCREVVGWGGRWAPGVLQALSAPPLDRLRVSAIATRVRCAERITLSPEGNDLAAMVRLVRRLHAAGQRLFVLSFHSSSLAVGRNPYVKTKAQMHYFYDRLSDILDFMASQLAMQFTSLSRLPDLLVAPDPAPGPASDVRVAPDRPMAPGLPARQD
jgi:hypothetical protein